MVKRLQRSSQVQFSPVHNLKNKNHKWGIEFEKQPLRTVPLGLRISCKAGLLFLNIFSGNLFFDVLIIGLLDLLI